MSIDHRLVNESLFIQAFKYAPIGMVLVAPNGSFLKANPAICSILGYSESELNNMTFQEITHPEDLEPDILYLTELLEGKRDSYQMEKRYIHKDGHIVWAMIAVSLVQDDKDVPPFFISQIIDITDQKHMESTLHEKEHLLRIISDNAQDIITFTAPDRVTRYISPAVRHLLGYEVVEVLGIEWTNLWHPDDLASFNQTGIFQDSDVDIFRCRVRHKQGHYVWFETTVKMIRDEKGEIAQVLGIGRDITTCKQTEDELFTTKERLESFIKNNGDAIWVIDRDGNVNEANAAFEKLFQWQSEEIINKPLPIIPEQLGRQTRVLHDHVLSGHSVIGCETIRLRKDGSLVDVSTTLSPIRDTMGHIIGIAGTCHDITEKKQAEQKLKATKEQLESYIDHNVDPVFILNTKYNVVRVNHAFEETFGWTSSEIVGSNVFDLPLIPYELKPGKVLALEKMKPLSIETVRRKKDGIEIPVMASVFTIQDEARKHNGWAVTLRDITAYKQAEELLINSEKLSIAGQLAAGIAHEIRNPITAIKGFMQLIKSGAAEKKMYYDIMSSEIERIEMILSELLILAKPQMLHSERKDIRILLAQVITLLESQAIMNNVQIVTEFETGITHILCDENQLKQVCINFLKNAIEAMPLGGTIVIQLKNTSEDRILLRFIDHGCGIPEQVLSKLGQPFYTTKEKGTGLGFMVSKKIIENHHGAVTVLSKENEGTTVEVCLPTAR